MSTDFVYYGTWRLFTDWPYCTLAEGGKLIKYSHQMSPPPKKKFWVFLIFERVLTIFYIEVPEECLLIVHAVLYLKKVNWSNIVTKCPLHPKRNFEFFWFFQEYWQFFYILGTWRMFIDCPCCTVPDKGKLIKYSHQMSPPPKKKFVVFLIFPRVLTIFLHSGTWRVFTDWPYCTVPE